LKSKNKNRAPKKKYISNNLLKKLLFSINLSFRSIICGRGDF
jgi:hypothetical protein